MTYIEKNLAEVRQTLAQAESAVGREGKTTLIAAVKYASDEELARLLSLGITDVGENRVQQLLSHLPLYEGTGVRVHFIGTLQKNKVKYLVGRVAAIHSVDSAALAREIEKQAAKQGVTVPVYAEVNSGCEESKGGVLPEEAMALCREISALPHLHLEGLMTMAPHQERAEDYRPYFARTRELANEIWQALSLVGEPRLSMGMSESFAEAVAEGADAVRVGRRLFVKEKSE